MVLKKLKMYKQKCSRALFFKIPKFILFYDYCRLIFNTTLNSFGKTSIYHNSILLFFTFSETDHAPLSLNERKENVFQVFKKL